MRGRLISFARRHNFLDCVKKGGVVEDDCHYEEI